MKSQNARKECVQPWIHRSARRHRPLFLKLLGVIALTLVAVNLTVFLFWKHAFHYEVGQIAERHFRQYAISLLAEVPLDLNSQTATEFSQQYGMEIVRSQKEGRITSPEAVQLLDKMGGEKWIREECDEFNPKENLRLIWRRGIGGVLQVHASDTTLLLVSMRPFAPTHHDIFGLLTILTVVMGFTALGVHHLLKPMRRLQKGVLAIESGDFGFRLKTDSQDEVARISASFNSMAESIQRRIEAREQLLRDVSHEFRSPLTRIRLATEMLTETSLQKDLLEDISILETMVQEILESDRMASPAGKIKSQKMDLVELIHSILPDFESRPPTIQLNDQLEPIWIMGDGERLRIALRNLFDNAVKYSSDQVQPVEVSLTRSKEFWVLRIRDYGPGIPEPEHARIFEPFYRLDKARTMGQGFGLGLALAKRICDAHGISITLESNSGGGATFQLDFPIAA